MENVSVLRTQQFLKSSNGKILLMVILVLIMMGAAFSLTMWLTAPRVSEVTTEPIPKPQTVPPPASPGTSAEEKGADSFEIYQSKDPFDPLVGAQASQPAPASPGATPAAPGATPSAPVGRTQITLMDIFTENNVKYASIQVGSTLFKVTEGETFSTSYKLVSAGTDTATILYGDDNATLKIGESVFK
jgi:hypothetical protein